jgi:hypothetical protein
MSFNNKDDEMLKLAASVSFCTVLICAVIWWFIAN